MTIVLLINIVLAAIVFSAVVGFIAWTIRVPRPSTEVAVAGSLEVREHRQRARAAHAERARAARAYWGVETA
jgi:uncharacterized iron-regulated membrane protein